MISVFGSLVGDDEIQNVVKVMQSQWMGFGKNVDIFEEAYKKKFNLQNFAMVDSGSNALFMAIKLLNLPPNSEVIVPSFTWVSCAQAVLLCGLTPVFCDVNLRTMNIDKKSIEDKITNRTAAIMVVHYAGLPVEMDEILNFGYPVVEDSAHAVCSTYKGIPCGAIGDVGIYSFDAVKNLTVGEGGGLTTKVKNGIERAKIMRYCGIGKSGFDTAMTHKDLKNRWWEYQISEPFIKMLPTNIAAAIGIAQLNKIEQLQERRKQIWDIYQDEFSNVNSLIKPIDAPSHTRHSYFTYCIRAKNRDGLANYLLDNGIYTTLRYHPLHLNKIYNQENIELKNSEILNEDALSLPLHPRLTDLDVEKIITEVKRFYAKKSLC